MNRKSLCLGLGVTLFLASVSAAILFLVHHEPSFYYETDQPPGIERKKNAGEFSNKLAQLYQDITDTREWHGNFHQDWINSFFQEHFGPGKDAEKYLPEGISAPRILIEPEKIRLAFRYNLGLVNTVVSIDMRLWLTSKEPNVVALEFQALHAGSLPIAAQSLLDRIWETARQNNIDVTYYRFKGNPVALLRFQADKDHPTYRIDQLILRDQCLEVRGRSIEAASLTAMAPPPEAPAPSP